MKKYLFLLLMTVSLLVVPFNVNADSKKTVLGNDYSTKNFVEALQEEEMDIPAGYSENNDQATIYLFRGNGCSFCRAYLTFMTSIAEEYGKYFKIVSFEVWNDENNWNLLNQISYLKEGDIAQGVPYIIIGEKVFGGYASEYDEEIKKAIMDLYNTDKKDRYDIFEVAEKEGLISIEELQEKYGQPADETGTAATTTTSSSGSGSNLATILWTLGFVVCGTVVVILFNNYKFNKLEEQLRKIKKSSESTTKSSKRK